MKLNRGEQAVSTIDITPEMVEAGLRATEPHLVDEGVVDFANSRPAMAAALRGALSVLRKAGSEISKDPD